MKPKKWVAICHFRKTGATVYGTFESCDGVKAKAESIKLDLIDTLAEQAGISVLDATDYITRNLTWIEYAAMREVSP